MGVMSCSRRGCDEIMCHTHVTGVGYICRSCQEEFKLYLQRENKDPKTEIAIIDELKEFMETYKNKYSDNPEMDINEFFDKYSN